MLAAPPCDNFLTRSFIRRARTCPSSRAHRTRLESPAHSSAASFRDLGGGTGIYFASAPAPQPTPEHVRAFIQEYFDAWKGTDEEKILAYYSDDVVISLPTGLLEGKAAVRDNFVRPFIAGFPGNVHAIQNLAFAPNLIAVEWSFEAVHSGAFGELAPTGNHVKVPGCSLYQHDLGKRIITGGRIYFDFGTLLHQLSA